MSDIDKEVARILATYATAIFARGVRGFEGDAGAGEGGASWRFRFSKTRKRPWSPAGVLPDEPYWHWIPAV